jgi:hypothetical protein
LELQEGEALGIAPIIWVVFSGLEEDELAIERERLWNTYDRDVESEEVEIPLKWEEYFNKNSIPLRLWKGGVFELEERKGIGRFLSPLYNAVIFPKPKARRKNTLLASLPANLRIGLSKEKAAKFRRQGATVLREHNISFPLNSEAIPYIAKAYQKNEWIFLCIASSLSEGSNWKVLAINQMSRRS